MRVGSMPSVLQGEIRGPSTGVRKSSSSLFVEAIKVKVQEVDSVLHEADQAMREGALNGAQRIEETMIKIEEAELSLRLMVKARDKALEAYREAMRMQF